MDYNFRWSYFNYWNDEFYAQWYHQLFFSLSELVSTCLILRLADMQTPVTLLPVLPVIAVAAVHIVVATTDQFAVNVVQGQGSTHQVRLIPSMVVGDDHMGTIFIVFPLLDF